MNRNLLQWILIAAVIIGAAGYLVLSETSSNSKKEQIVVGHSKAFKIEPVEGITISAPKNALDKDREFKLTAVSEKQWEKDAKVVSEHFGVKPFLVMDLDAGMDPNELLPGTYTVQMDLKKMGVPKNLWRHVNVYRVAHGGKKGDCYEYNSRVNANGILSFESNQNSGVVLAIAFGEMAWQAFGYTLMIVLLKAGHDWFVMSDIRNYFEDPKDVMVVPIEDPNGNFRVFFRWKDTMRGLEGRKAFEENEEKAMARLDELEKEAEEEYERRVNKMATGKEKLDWWEKIANKSARDEAMKMLAIDSVLKELLRSDSLLRVLNADPASQLPLEVEKNIEQIKRANDYLKNAAKVKPLTYSIAIYLMNAATMGSSNGLNTTPYVGHCYIKVNMDAGLEKGEWKNAPEYSQSALLTLIHECFHARQQSNYCHIIPMRMLPAEATAPVLEKDAARYLYENGRIISVNPDTKEGSSIQFTGRSHHLIHAIPLDKISPKINGMDAEQGASVSYSLADLIEIVRESSGKKNVGMVRFCEEYSRNRKFSVLIKKALDIDDATFEKGWEEFVKNKIGTIVSSQQTAETQKQQNFKDCWQTNFTFAESDPIMKIKVEKDKYYVRSWYFANKGKEPSIYIKPAKGGSYNSQIHFYLKNDSFVDGKEEPCIYMKDEPCFMAMDVANLDLSCKKEDLEYDVVAFFPPDKPTIRKVKDDKITFIVPKPARALTKEKLISGVVVTYKDKNGKEITREIEPKYFGKKATWTVTGCSKKGNSFTLSLHWFYKLDEQTTYVSPESDPAQWGAKGDQPEEEELVLTKEPETNYWKQVSSRMTMKNTSIDVDESNDDEVSSDYRSIDLQAAKTGRSLEFTGMGATEEKTKENGRVYVQDIFIEGTLTYTEPPKFWIPTQQYKAHWEIADDPYLTKVSDPFVFEAKNTSSDQAACAQSKKDKIDNGRSPIGKANWLRGSTTTFEARHPEKNGPKSFTLTQTYSIKERQGSDLMATVTFVYNYEWVGEEEPEPELETENVPEGGCWKLVKTETNDSHMTFKSKNGSIATISGGAGEYTVHIDYVGYVDVLKDIGGGQKARMQTDEKDVVYTVDRRMHFDTPKSFYLPGEKGPGCVIEELQREKKRLGTPNHLESPNDHCPTGEFRLEHGDFEYKRTAIRYNYFDFYLIEQARERKVIEGRTIPIPNESGWGDGFKIFLLISTQFPECYMTKTYTYEWVEDGKKAKPVKESAKEKPISGGHWKLALTSVVDETASYTSSDGEEKIQITGSNGHYSVHAEYTKKGKTYCTMDREINFEKPKSTYKPEEILKLEITNEKVKLKGKPEYGLYPYGEHIFSNFYKDDYSYDAIRNPKKVVSTTTYEVSKKNCSAGTIGFSIHERARFGMAEVRTNYLYEWVD